MAEALNYLAIDLGASSGRAIIGSFDGSRVALREVHRFANGPVERAGGLFWDAPGLLHQITASLGTCAGDRVALAGMGIDTWGVDYGLLDARGELLGLPRHYRDPRTRGLIDAAAARVPHDQIYGATGIQFMELNTLYQLMADQRDDPQRLAAADTLLFMPNLLNFWLTGIRQSERSIASTSQLFDPGSNRWATGLLERLGLPTRILPEAVPSGTVVGPLLAGLSERTGVGHVPVIAPACHDTASAVAAVPARGTDWAYISSGTWSLVGIELDRPIRSPEAMAANFTNELGVGGTVRFLTNVAGLWLLQECKRVWASHGREYDFEKLDAMARGAVALRCLIDPDDPGFASFGDMPERIRAKACRFGPAPTDDSQLVRCIFDSLALKYALAIDRLRRLTGRDIRTVHMVGGGIRERLLCQLTADATGLPVHAGPVEATAMGNILVQAMTQGRIASREQLRSVVAASDSVVVYEPRDAADWQAAVARLTTSP